MTSVPSSDALMAFASQTDLQQAFGAAQLAARAEEFAGELRRAFDADFTILNVESGEVVLTMADGPCFDYLPYMELCRAAADRREVEFVADECPVVLLAVPLVPDKHTALVGIAPFLLDSVQSAAELASSAAVLGVGVDDLFCWAQRSEAWTEKNLRRVARLAMQSTSAQIRVRLLSDEVEQVSGHLLATYEEISLLYRLTQNLKISRSPADLAQLALEWLASVVPAEGFAVRWKAECAGDPNNPDVRNRDVDVLLTHGDWPVDQLDFEDFVECMGREAIHEPIVLNRRVTSKPTWTFPRVHEVVSVPLSEGGKIFGWLLAVNHADGAEFGTVEASLLGSVGAILGIHGANIDLYRQQAELLSGVVRALTSSIDAKDPYTCGHSDRVARVSVRLAEELGCDTRTQNTIYLSGLLHDIGKIGIDDQVLRKPGKLTEAEYEHIKLHPELGYKILRDLKQLGEVLPVVLHHHEGWDGKGYPFGLAGEEIPFLARIVAVADSFDAMSSDRPYRKGMPYDRLEQILREGAGTQWDPQVVEAFLRVREEILEISRHEREALALDMQQWA